ncbi:hypothetical protein [Piscibacillus salipiscarius]|uniref:Uncharacterized protein n=1 Tax=Piscibacillus salipiscarius TaxID=299480 RepID=A0ABW5Q9Z7_9BACI|nr:hypothetical protein [Piscibacillus salipiscarius]
MLIIPIKRVYLIANLASLPAHLFFILMLLLGASLTDPHSNLLLDVIFYALLMNALNFALLVIFHISKKDSESRKENYFAFAVGSAIVLFVYLNMGFSTI